MTRSALLASCLFLAACGDPSSGSEVETPQLPTGESGSETQAPQGTLESDPLVEDAAQDMATRLAALPAPYSEADLANGARQFRRCTSCHTIGEGGPHRVGPNLHGLFRRTAGEAEGFNYSPALREAGFDWTPDHLDAWLADPRGYIPGNRMSFVGLRDADDRRDVIAYLLLETEL
ncbi:c-type cytochrome [Hyphobacterium marinum]|uniref:Cytochrome c family protein n=1 Tax=Hyphobacterium marinum TaxID=3116574 RepID=A0ABU7M1P8_9PROT|nr:cytochrome c family protein [Hyphobacterium sp. Y6023]MEE2567729.1 cytochrome c family protein [Hyphobacterium sp. Y6023]